jgi:hypothetical protein
MRRRRVVGLLLLGGVEAVPIWSTLELLPSVGAGAFGVGWSFRRRVELSLSGDVEAVGVGWCRSCRRRSVLELSCCCRLVL